jgi:ligand-binding sensor domain-containing protein
LRYLLSILFVVFLAGSIQSQKYQLRHYGVEEGLPSSEVYHVYQDSEGYMWIATNMGISKYDGYEFENFDLEGGLPGNTIFEVYEDYKGRIWFLSFSMKLSYYYQGEIHTYQYNDVIRDYFVKDLPFQKLSFYVDKQDNVYFAIQSKNVYKVSSDGEITTLIKDSEDKLSIFKKGSKYFNIHEEGSYDQLRIFSEDTSYIRDMNLKVREGNLNHFACKHKNSLYLTLGNTLFHIRKDTILSRRDFKKQILWLNIDKGGNLWIGLAGGALRLDKNNIHRNRNFLLEDLDISSVYRDREGGFWFSTLQDGLYYVSDLTIKTLTKEEGLFSSNIGVLAKDKYSRIWVGHKKPIISILKDQKILKTLKLQEYKTGGIEDIKFGPDQFAYIIRWNKIFSYDLNSFERHKKLLERNESANSLLFINDQKKVFCGAWGIKIFKGDENIYNSCHEDKFCHRIRSLFYSENDSALYLGGLNGFWRYKDGKFKHLGERNDLLYYRVVDIVPFKEYLALATRGGGIILYSENSIHQITKQSGLLGNSVNSLYVNGNDIWVAQNLGLSKITFHDVESELYDIHNLTKQDGLPSSEINDISIDDSIVYVATNNGLSYFNFLNLKKNVIPPPVKIKGVKINGVDTSLKSIYRLDHNRNFFSITYVGLTYRQAGDINYRYKMKGLNDQWTITNRNRKTFTTLPPGDYEFIVQAQNEDGVWSKDSATIKFHIDAPFWKEWWFIASVIVFVVGLLWLFFYFRLSMIRRRNELMQDINEYKQKILRQQMNPHFIFNTLNSIQYFLLDEDTTSSLNYLTKFAKMMRIVLDNSQQTFVPIEDEIRGLNLYLELEALRFEESFDYQIKVDDEINTYEYKVPALILQPYVENSIRHGLLHKKNKGFLKVHITKKDESLLCAIEDDGVGRKRAEEIKMSKGPMKQSLGSKITEDRINVLNSLYSDEIDVQYIDLEDEQGNPRGTRVEITLPFIF